jgi:predicted dehydrogenase
MSDPKQGGITRRTFLGASSAFMIVPRHVLGGHGFVPPSDMVTLASVGLGRQGMFVTMDLLARPEVRVVAVCDPNRGSKEYAEYGPNDTLLSVRRLLGAGYENWGEDLASPGEVYLTHSFKTSLGIGGREPATRVVEAYYGAHKPSGNYTGCNAYRDYREMLEKEKDLDAIYVATPDHWHAPISLAAMRKGKHVLCQKPMTHSIGEARRMAEVAQQTKLATSVTVNNPSSAVTKVLSEWIGDGAIGTVREVHNWSSRPYWPHGVARPKEAQPVPDGLDWDLWLGPAAARPYNKAYLPFVWRGWYDFGCGALGDMGCYSYSGLFKILDLTPPVAVESSTSESFEETYPLAEMIHYYFPSKGTRAPVHYVWYDGGLKPPRPELLPDGAQFGGRDREGILYIGDKGVIVAGFNGDGPRVYPESKKYVYTPPPRTPGSPTPDAAVGMWVAACKGGPPAAARFETQAPVTETLLLGCLAPRFPGDKLLWDSATLQVTNKKEANKYVDPPYRDGWTA